MYVDENYLLSSRPELSYIDDVSTVKYFKTNSYIIMYSNVYGLRVLKLVNNKYQIYDVEIESGVTLDEDLYFYEIKCYANQYEIVKTLLPS